MKTRKIRTSMFALLAIMLSMACLATPAIAVNASTTSWSVYVTGWKTADTPNRQKQDASPGYIKAEHVSGGRAVRAWMLGFSNEDVQSATVTMASGWSAHVDNRTYQLFGKKQVHMRLQNTKSYSTATEAYGVWSPDSR